MNTNKLSAIIDLGASRIKAGIMESVNVIPDIIEETPKETTSIIENIVSIVEKLSSIYSSKIKCTYISCPGLINNDGLITKVLRLPLSNFNLRKELEYRLNHQIIILNDAKIQGMGCLDGNESLFFMTIGTGIGGALIDNGRIIFGDNGFAGEIGHIPFGISDLWCDCGQYGCLDTIASGWVIEKKLGKGWWNNSNHETIKVLYNAGIGCAKVASIVSSLIDSNKIVIVGNIVSNFHFKSGFSTENFRNKPFFSNNSWPFVRHGFIKYKNYL